MDDHTLTKLQFEHIKDALAGHCSCSLGQSLAQSIKPAGAPKRVRHWLGQVAEMMAVQTEFGLPPLGGVRDIRRHIHDSSNPAGLEAEALADVKDTLVGALAVRSWLASLPDDVPLLKSMLARVGDFTPVVEKIDDAIDSRGRVRDTASKKLASLRSVIESTEAQIGTVFDHILKNQHFLKLLQYPKATIHNDRRVLPLKTEQRGRIPGIIHRSSDSGATLYVEPAEAVELNNAVIRLRYKEHEEITRILSALGRLVHLNAEEILSTLKVISVLDLIAAKVRFAKRYRAVCPIINDDGILDLQGARHPALIDLYALAEQQDRQPMKVVPIDIRVGDDFDLLVITGPNTGGKTVALKTVGLLAAMTQSGIPIPVDEGTTLPVYKHIFIDVGDEQSIEQSLSTFSSHLSNILSMLKRACRGSLVLIDELGAGTDPDEGAAIGWAVMDQLLASGCAAVVTTHLSPLKAVAYSTARVDNASVEFDSTTLKPTYVLRVGEPGNSNALIIAERLGMPKRMIGEARSRLSNRQRALSKAIEGTLESRRRAEQARKDAAKSRSEMERARFDFEEKAKLLEQARAVHQQWMQWIDQLNPGDWVYVKTFEKCAKVVRMQLHKQLALVSLGAVDYEVPLNEISKPSDNALPDVIS